MYFTPLFSASCIPRVVVFALGCRVKSSTLFIFFYFRVAMRWTAGLCHEERLNTVITLSSPRAQHSPSHRQQVPVLPNQKPNTCQTAERQTGNSSLMHSICRPVSNLSRLHPQAVQDMVILDFTLLDFLLCLALPSHQTTP